MRGRVEVVDSIESLSHSDRASIYSLNVPNLALYNFFMTWSLCSNISVKVNLPDPLPDHFQLLSSGSWILSSCESAFDE